MAAPAKTPSYDELLAEEVSNYYADPLGFVLSQFGWTEPGMLEHHPGPDTWQAEFLAWLGDEVATRGFDGMRTVEAIRAAVSSGHGCGKSTLVAWVVLWIMSTRPHCQGTITSNTITQLSTKTWAAIETWTKRCKTGHWFTVNSERMFRNGFKESWFCAPQSSKENNSEAFAGQHAAGSTSFYIVDEASAIPDTILEVAEGGLTDGEPMIFMFGNPTRSQGGFYRACFGSMRHRWHPTIIDSRTSRFTNKTLIEEWATDYGEESDFFRVRVRGLPPAASDIQFISTALVTAAQNRQAICLPDDPLVCGLDLARGGADDCVFRFRRGLDARSIPPIRVIGAQARDSMKLVTIAADVLSKDYNGIRVAAMFVDATGGSIGGPIADRLRQMNYSQVIDVQFGGESPEPNEPKKYANMRAYIWGRCRDWLVKGAIDALPALETDLTGPSYYHDKQDRLLLESKEAMKKRGLDSPDDGDALCWVAGTMVRTPSGPRSIETIEVGDYVDTPMGARRVLVTHESDTDTLTTIECSDGRRLTGKGAHRIYSWKTGPERIDAIPLDSAIASDSLRERLQWWLLVKSCIAAKPSGFKRLAATTNPGGMMRRRDFYIGASGLSTTGLFLMASRCIMSTVIGRIMTPAILSLSQAGFTRASMFSSGGETQITERRNWLDWNRSDHWQKPGTPARKDERGTAPMRSLVGLIDNPRRLSAWCAVRRFTASSLVGRAFGSALGPVLKRNRISGTRRLFARVPGVVSLLRAMNTARRGIAVTAVQTRAVPTTKTYNLTVEREHVYYANGILCENCLTFAQEIRAPRPVHRPAPNFARGPQGWMNG